MDSLPLSPGTHTGSLNCGGHLRRWLLHVPPNAPRASPVVMMLHGAGADVTWTLEETRWDDTANRGGFLLLLPEALPLDPSRPYSFLNNPTWWNDGSPASRTARREVDDVAFLTTLLDRLGERVRLATGFSNGAAMTFRLAIERSERLTAIAPIAGYCWLESARLERPMPTLYLVGGEDPLVPILGGTVRSPWGWSEERPPLGVTLERWKRALGETRFEVRTIDGLGHHWPGGRGILSRRLFGPPRDDVKANELVWGFFHSVIHVSA